MKMYDGVLRRVKKLEEKNGIHYASTDGKLYKTARVFFVIAFAWGMAINLLYLLGMAFTKSTAKEIYTYILTPAVCTAALIAGFILLLKKINIAGGILSVVPACVLAVFFIPLLEGDYVGTLNPKYYWGHLAPMALIVITAFIMTLVAVRANIKLKKMYLKVVGNIYNTYKINAENGEDMSEEQWQEFLESFDPYNYNRQFEKNTEQASE